jgi:PAS domain S-box-containing protein
MAGMKPDRSSLFRRAAGRRQLPRVPGRRDRALQAALPQGIVYYGHDGAIVEANPAGERLLRLTLDPATGSYASEPGQQAIWPDGRPIAADEHPVTVALSSGEQTGPVEFGITSADLGLRWLHVTVIPLSASNGSAPYRAVAIHEDITARRRAEEELRISEARLQRFVDANVLGIVSADERGITEANDAFLDSVGYSREDFAHGVIDWRAMTPPEWSEISEQAVRDIRELGACAPFRKEYVRKDGSRVPVVVGAAAYDQNPLSWICFVLDLSEQESAQREIARQAGMLDQAYDAIFAWDWGGGITYWNRGAQRLYGYIAEEAIGRVSHELLRTEHRGGRGDFLAELEARGFVEEEVTHVHRDGRRLTVGTRHVLVQDPVRPYVLEVSRDITSRIEIEAERRAFIDTLAHDLKNPLGAVKATAQLVQRRLAASESVDRSVVERSMANVLSAVDRMTGMIDQMLDTAHLRDGQPLVMQCEPTDLVAIARAARESADRLTTRHTVRLETDLMSLVGNWDRSRLERVLGNLLENAIKYSPEADEVEIRLGAEERPDSVWACLRVTDFGLGIPAGEIGRVFDQYRRGSNVAGRISGAGIGLAGVKHIIEQHRGTIEVESVEGRGSTFTVWLPVDRPED